MRQFAMEQAKGTLEPARIFWKVTSQRQSNGTQTVTAFVREQVYDRFSGDTERDMTKIMPFSSKGSRHTQG
jgi:hypothetical protein